ncbi:MAG: leucine-rich repeat protein [Dehalobacter sp.]|nr:leucine-rich repeat protein [Dehalobacter sp.]
MNKIKMKGKKAMALLLCTVMIFGFVPLKAHATEYSGTGYTYDDTSKTLTITDNDGMTNWKSDSNVTNDFITYLIIGNEVTTVPDNAFSDLLYLATVSVGSSVTSIGSYAFSGDKFYQFSFPSGSSLTSIGNYAFTNNTGFTSFTLPDSVETIGDHAFEGCTALTSFTLPSTITSIGNYVFASCGFTSLTIPDTVTSIGDYSYSLCTSLTGVTVSDSVYSVGANAFSGCTALTSAYFPDMTAPTVEAGAFANCASGFSIYYPLGATGYDSLGYLSQTPYGSDISISGNIVINFAETMDTEMPGTVTLTSLDGSRTLSSGAWSGNTFTIPYTGLAYETEYTVAATGFKNSSNADVAVSSHEFTTVSVSGAPTVSVVTPSGTDINNNGNIVITFSEAMDETMGTVSLDGGSTYLSGGSWSADGQTYTIPYSNIAYGTMHTVTIMGFKDAAGTEMTMDSTHSFTTHTAPDAINCDLYYGSITVSGSTLTYYDNTSAQVSQTINSYDNIVIMQTNSTTATANTITVDYGTTAKITLSGVNISAGAPFSVKGSIYGTTLNLLLVGDNTLTATADKCSGLDVDCDSTLNILPCDGSLTATGAKWGAGIGSLIKAGQVNIYGGNITSYGGSKGAGIGASCDVDGYYNEDFEVNIYGGTITATGGEFGAGIGNAYYSRGDPANSNGGSISISGGTITTNGGNCAAGIGSGYMSNISNISISSGTVTATAGKDGAGIGSGESGSAGSIEISGGTVIANAYADVDYTGKGAAIGGGYGASGGNIKISGGNVTANGQPPYAAVIGSGYNGSGSTVEISGGFVKTNAASNGGAAIGSGMFAGNSTVTINGGTVLTYAYSGDGLIGDGASLMSGTPSTIKISGGSVKALPTANPTSDGTTPVYKTVISDLPTSTAVTSEIDHYSSDSSDADKTYAGSNPCVTDSSGNIYLWLPENSAKLTTVVVKDTSVAENGYYAASGYVTTGTNNFTESRNLPSYIRASTLALPESYTMNVNQTHTFYAVAEDCAYRGAAWTSSNPEVATVSQDGDGVVTTVGWGETTISATSYDGGFTGSFVLRVDTIAPSGYTVSINDSDGVYINKADVTADSDFSFTISGAEVGSTLSYTVNRTTFSFNAHTWQWEESSPVLYKSDSVTVTDAMQNVSIGTLATDGSTDGKYYLSVTLTDTAGNTSTAMTDAIIVDTTPTSGDILYFNNGNNIAYSENADKVLTYWYDSAIYMEYNAVFKYTLTSKTGGSPVSGSIAMTEENLIPPASSFRFYIDMSALPDGDFDFVYSFTDPAGNKSADYTYTYHKDVSIPTCDLSFGQAVINSTNQTAISFTLDNISEALRYKYTISDGTNSVDKSTYKSTTETTSGISNIDLSSLSDGMLTLTVKMYDSYANLNFYTATIIKDTIAPTVTLPAVSTAAASIGLNFNETVNAVEGKTITCSDGTDTYTYTIASADNYISGEGSACKAAIPLTAFLNGSNTLTLDSTKTYTVNVDAGTYMDTAGNELANVSLEMVVAPKISPVTGSFDRNPANQIDVQTTVTWGSATGITDVKAGGSSIGAGNYSISGNTLTIRKEYLAAQATGSLLLTIEFNEGATAMLTITITDTTPPSISPASCNYDLSTLSADVTTTITWNSAASVTDVVYSVSPDTTIYMLDISNYTVSDDTLTISNSFFSGLSLTTGATLEFNIIFNTGATSTLMVNVVNGYIQSSNADLSSLSVNDTPVSGFDPDDTEYDAELPYGATSATVSATANDSNAQVSITQASSLPGSAIVSVTAEDGSTTRTYTVNLTIAELISKYTVTFNSNGSEYATKTVNAGTSIGSAAWPADPARSSYTFGGWFTGENGAGTQFIPTTPVNATMTVYAKWTYNGDSSGGGSDPSDGGSTPSTPLTPTHNANVNTGSGTKTTIPVMVDKDAGTASIDIGLLSLNQDRTIITIPSISDVNAYSVGIPVSELLTTGEQGTVTVNTDIGSITVPSNMLTGVEGISGSKAQISIGHGDKNALPPDVKAAIGDKPLISLSLSIDGKQTYWSNPNAPVTVSIPYTPTASELANPESIVIWYIDGSGNVVSVPNGHYDPVTGTVTFSTTHFSDYAVAYNKVSFNDVAAGAWYSKAVGFIAARGITTGTGNGNFSPDAKLTRGDFLVMLMRAYGIAPAENPQDNFADAGSTYYTGYMAAAKQLGISRGVGSNMFAPDKEITRQEMFTLLYNALKGIRQLPQGDSGKTISDFADAGQTDSWAKDAMTLLVETGTVGGSGGALTPLSTTFRAEMAQVLFNLLRE